MTDADFYSTTTEVTMTILILYAGLICIGLMTTLIGFIMTVKLRKAETNTGILPVEDRYLYKPERSTSLVIDDPWNREPEVWSGG